MTGEHTTSARGHDARASARDRAVDRRLTSRPACPTEQARTCAGGGQLRCCVQPVRSFREQVAPIDAASLEVGTARSIDDPGSTFDGAAWLGGVLVVLHGAQVPSLTAFRPLINVPASAG